ncbi:hypothetical protein HMPREF1248_1004 [Coriobacteriaceae bacterium BV3Ac1]|nr:hypothetical protein HMPREF1248_1004 [Coriobacteriaceae bacterium BV3Ac1]
MGILTPGGVGRFHFKASLPHTMQRSATYASTNHQPRFRLRDVPGRLPRRLGRRVPRPRHPRAAGRVADRERHLDHRRRRDHHRRCGLLRDARHVLAPGVGDANVTADTHTEGHRRVPGEDRREDELPHPRLRRRWLRLHNRRRVHRLLRLRRPGRERDAARHGSGPAFLARRLLASLRDEARGVPAVVRRPPPKRAAHAVPPLRSRGRTRARGEAAQADAKTAQELQEEGRRAL